MNHTKILLKPVTPIKPCQLLKTTQISIHKTKIKENPETANTRDHKLENPSKYKVKNSKLRVQTVVKRALSFNSSTKAGPHE